MKYTEHLQKLDDLIIEHTVPPATSALRAHLHSALEQAEAESAHSEKQDKLCKEQADTIVKLEGQIRKLLVSSKLKRPNPGVSPQAPNVF